MIRVDAWASSLKLSNLELSKRAKKIPIGNFEEDLHEYLKTIDLRLEKYDNKPG